MNKIAAGVLGAAAIAVSLVFLRQQRMVPADEVPRPKSIPAGEDVPADVKLDRLRELGL